MAYTIRTDLGDRWMYMAFDNKATADRYVALSVSLGIGAAYPDGGWMYWGDEQPDQVTVLVTEQMVSDLEQRINAAGRKDAECECYDFEGEYAFEDWDDELEYLEEVDTAE